MYEAVPQQDGPGHLHREGRQAGGPAEEVPGPAGGHAQLFICVCMYVCIYIYREREREMY